MGKASWNGWKLRLLLTFQVAYKDCETKGRGSGRGREREREGERERGREPM